MFVVELHPKHRSREHGLNAPFYFNMFFFHACTLPTGSAGEGDIPETGRKGRSQIKRRGPDGPDPAKTRIGTLVTVATAASTTAAAAAATIPTAAATAAASRSFFTRPSDVDREGAPAQLFAVEGVNGLLGLLRRTHGDESEPARTAGCPVHHKVGFDNRAVRRKGVLQVVFSDVEGKIPNKQFCAHVMSLILI